MILNSPLFLFAFLPLSLLVYYISSKTIRKYTLILLSIFFYAWFNIHLTWFLLMMSMSCYIFGYFIQKNIKPRLWCVIGIVFNISILIYYKYSNFFLSQINVFFSKKIDLLNYIIPLGISFITFQSVSYLMDSYRNKIDNANISDVILYISFFPKVSSGPITRFNDLANSSIKYQINLDSFEKGLTRLSVGLAKKVILADTIGLLVDNIFEAQSVGISPSSAWIATLGYTLQIFLDFSGYSDMAIGIAGLFGYKLSENFDYPYSATSMGDFWRRWHISLSSWFRDYLYIPLGGNRKGNVYLNIFIVFLATGLWHGDNWTFIVWGIGHGLLLIIERALRNTSLYNKIPKLIKWIICMVFVSFGWLLFKSPSLEFFYEHIKIMFGLVKFPQIEMYSSYFLTRKNIFLLCISVICVLPIGKKSLGYISQKFAMKIVIPLKYIMSIILLIISIMFMVNSTYHPFIYFQF